MRTLILQIVVSLCYGVFGGAAILASRAMPPAWPSKLFWRLTGGTFALFALNDFAQNILGTWAYFAGAESRVYSLYMWLAPMANHSRTFLVLSFCCVLSAMLVRSPADRVRYDRFAIPAICVGMMGGVLLGWYEGSLIERVHYTTVAITDVVELLFLLATLLISLAWYGVDRVLWFALGSYTFSVALNIIWTIALAGAGVGWIPSTWHMWSYRVVLVTIAAGLAVWRWRTARRGVFVTGLADGPSGGQPLFVR